MARDWLMKQLCDRFPLREHSMKQTRYFPLFASLAATAFVILVGIQFIRPELTDPPVQAEIQAPEEVRTILRHSCYNCHSNETKLSWFDRISPAYWFVTQDVRRARQHVNFSEIGVLSPQTQKAVLFDAVNQIQLGAMPLPSYRAVHRDSTITPEQLRVLRNYLEPGGQIPAATNADSEAANQEYVHWIQSYGTARTVEDTVNGVPFHPEYKFWKPVSSTERVENNTIRVVLGNDTAVRAIAEKHTNPWPNGTVIAKVTWREEPQPDGRVIPGTFVRVELMIRDREKYHATAGWGWGRWLGTDLKPDGHTPDFATRQCLDCHHAVRGNDYVFTMPIASSKVGLD
jgi:Haem-binding domain/Cytochrome P460